MGLFIQKLRGLGTPNSVSNRRQRGREAPGAGKIVYIVQWRWWSCRPLGQLNTRLKATLSNQSMNQHGAVEPPSRLDARAVQECLFFTSTLQLDSTHLAGDAELEQFYW